MAAGVSLLAVSAPRPADAAEPATDLRSVVRWDPASNQWAKRPADAAYGVIFLSTNDPRATAPRDSTLRVGDEWHQHPESSVA